LPASTSSWNTTNNNSFEDANFEHGLPSARLPGSIEVDPLVRKLTKREGLGVSESAIWFLVVAVREYAASVLEQSITNIEAIDSGQLPELPSFSQPVYSKIKGEGEKRKRSVNTAQPLDPAKEKKRRIITSIDLADVLSSRPMAGGGSTSRLVWERCISAAGSKMVSNIHPGLEAIQKEISALIRRRIVPDSSDDIVVATPKNDKSEESTSTVLLKEGNAAGKASESKKTKIEEATSPQKTEDTTLSQKPDQATLSKKTQETTQPKKIEEITELEKIKGEKSTEAKDNSPKVAGDDKVDNKAATKQQSLIANKEMIRGLGRGAKNLSALRARAMQQVTAKKVESKPTSENGEKPSGTLNAPEATPDPTQKEMGITSGKDSIVAGAKKVENGPTVKNGEKPSGKSNAPQTPPDSTQKEMGITSGKDNIVAGGRGAGGRGAGGRGAGGRGAGGRGAGGRGAGGRGAGGRGAGGRGAGGRGAGGRGASGRGAGGRGAGGRGAGGRGAGGDGRGRGDGGRGDGGRGAGRGPTGRGFGAKNLAMMKARREQSENS